MKILDLSKKAKTKKLYRCSRCHREVGEDKVYVIDEPLLESYCADLYAAAMEKLVREIKPEILLFGHN